MTILSVPAHGAVADGTNVAPPSGGIVIPPPAWKHLNNFLFYMDFLVGLQNMTVYYGL
jgi:hypothetical protein